MVADFYFQEAMNWLRRRFDEVGCPIPDNGFKTYKEYLAWNHKYWARWSKMHESSQFKKLIRDITRGKKSWGSEEQAKIHELEEAYLPPAYGSYFNDLLERFFIPFSKRKRFKDFLEHYLFLGKQEFSPDVAGIKIVLNREIREPELYLRVYGYTKLKDVESAWSTIADYQKDLPDYLGKNKGWESFDRDLRILNLYKKLKAELGTRKRAERSKNSMKRIDMQICLAIRREFSQDLDWENIRKIISKTKRRLKILQFKEGH